MAAIILKHGISHHLVDVERTTAAPGTLWYFRDNKTAFLALADGKLLPLTAILDGSWIPKPKPAPRVEVKVDPLVAAARAKAKARVEKALKP